MRSKKAIAWSTLIGMVIAALIIVYVVVPILGMAFRLLVPPIHPATLQSYERMWYASQNIENFFENGKNKGIVIPVQIHPDYKITTGRQDPGCGENCLCLCKANIAGDRFGLDVKSGCVLKTYRQRCLRDKVIQMRFGPNPYEVFVGYGYSRYSPSSKTSPPESNIQTYLLGAYFWPEYSYSAPEVKTADTVFFDLGTTDVSANLRAVAPGFEEAVNEKIAENRKLAEEERAPGAIKLPQLESEIEITRLVDKCLDAPVNGPTSEVGYLQRIGPTVITRVSDAGVTGVSKQDDDKSVQELFEECLSYGNRIATFEYSYDTPYLNCNISEKITGSYVDPVYCERYSQYVREEKAGDTNKFEFKYYSILPINSKYYEYAKKQCEADPCKLQQNNNIICQWVVLPEANRLPTHGTCRTYIYR